MTKLAILSGAAGVMLLSVLAGPASGGFAPVTMQIGNVLLWVAAVLTLWTGSDYLRAAIRHATSDQRPS